MRQRPTSGDVFGWLLTSGGLARAKTPLFRSVNKHPQPTDNPMNRRDVLRMIKRRAKAAGLPYSTCCHTFRATGITAYLENGGTIENARRSPRMRVRELPSSTIAPAMSFTLDEVERIGIWAAYQVQSTTVVHIDLQRVAYDASAKSRGG